MRIVETGDTQIMFFHAVQGVPMRINLGISALRPNPYTLTIDDITVARKPPLTGPSFVYNFDSLVGPSSFIDLFFQFRYRYIYDDGEISTWSPFSVLSIPPQDGVSYNKIVVTFNSGVKGVKKVQIARRIGNGISDTGSTNPFLYIFRTWDKGVNADNTNFTVDFLNTEVLIPVAVSDSNKLFDSVPQKVGCQEIVQSNQVIYGDVTEGYDNIVMSASLARKTSQAYFIYEITDAATDYIQLPIDGSSNIPSAGDILVCEPTSNPNAIAFSYILQPADVASVDAFGLKIASLLNNYGLVNTASYNSTLNRVIATNLITYISYVIGVKGSLDKIMDVAKFSCNAPGVYASAGVFSVNWTDVDFAAGTVISYFYTADNPSMYMCRVAITLDIDCSNNTGGAFTSIDIGVYKSPSTVLVQRPFALPSSGVLPLSFEFDIPAALCQNEQIGIRFVLNAAVVTTQTISVGPGNVVFSLYSYELIQPSFKSGQTHKMGIVYYDEYNRQTGVQKCGEISFPFISEQNQNYDINSVRLTLSNLPPVWAKKYQIVYSGCGLTNYSQFTVFPTAFEGNTVTINVASIIYYPYDFKEFAEGQKIRFIFSTIRGNFLGTRWSAGNLKYYETTIKSFDSSSFSLVVNNPDGILNSITLEDKCFVEVSVPSNSEFYFEFGQIYDLIGGYHMGNIQNQTALLPAIIDILSSDTYIRGRKNYVTTDPTIGGFSITDIPDTIVFTETFTITDNAESNYWNKGRPQIETPDQRQQKIPWLYRWGNQLLQDTQVNGMSSFDSGNYGVLSARFGALTGMREIGYTLKMIQEQNYNSAFIGRRQIQNADGSTQLVVTDSLIGSVNPSEEMYGTKYPGSIITNGRRLYWLDTIKGCVIREAGNQPFRISDYGMVRYWRDACRQIEVLGYEVLTGWDWQTESLFITRKSDLIASGETINFYDPERESGEAGWVSEHDFKNAGGLFVDMYGFVGKTFTSTLASGVYIHNSVNSYLNLYGQAKTFSITSIFNPELDTEKVFLAHWMKANQSLAKSIFTVPVSAQNPNGMRTYLVPGNYAVREAQYFADLKNDGYTKGSFADDSAIFRQQMISGRPLREQVCFATIEYAGSTIFVLFSHDITYNNSPWS
jgi:hypothetical protein